MFWMRNTSSSTGRRMRESLTIEPKGASGKAVAAYKGGSFFKGLGRPWMGLHTIDTVRRDAAEKQVWFETRHLPDGSKVEVILTHEQTRLVYTFDIQTDVIEKITFSVDNGGEGELEFSSLQNIDKPGKEFFSPRVASYRKLQQNPPGMLWLVKLINSRWGIVFVSKKTGAERKGPRNE